MKKLFLFFINFFLCLNLFSQNCDIRVDSLKGKYTGDCRKGLANGYGTAIGVDSYTGNFKNGYPDGQGKYTWKNGSWYDGNWKNGLFDGNGTFSQIDAVKKDSATLLTGFWKKGKYVGKYQKPYSLKAITNGFSELNIRKKDNSSNTIMIVVNSVTAGASSMTASHLPKPHLTDISTIEGKFEQQVNDENSSIFTNTYTLRGVTFPYHAILSFETPHDAAGGANLHVEKIEVEIAESASWYIQVKVDN